MPIKDKNLYYVGGVVRDEILGIPSFDVDLCYEGNAIEFSKNFNITKTNPDFGTVRISYDGKEIDIASTRTETYPKAGHLPVVSNIGCTLKEDLKRRDFTINALAKNTVTNEVIDFFDGIKDLKNKKLKVLHDKSFIEDPSRIIRGLKFSVRFNFELEDYTKILQEKYLENINYDMSYHRLKKELIETFSLKNNIAYEKFINQGIYKLLGKGQSIPNLNIPIDNVINKYPCKYPYMVYLGLFDLSNFDLNKQEQEILNDYKIAKSSRPKSNIEIYKLFNGKSIESILLYAVTIDTEIALKYLDTLANTKIEINGEDLKRLGISQGSIYKEIFEDIINEKINNPSLTKEEELKLVAEKYL